MCSKCALFLIENIFSYNTFRSQFLLSPDSSQILPMSPTTQLHAFSLSLSLKIKQAKKKNEWIENTQEKEAPPQSETMHNIQ